MGKRIYIMRGLLHAAGVLLYITSVAWFLFNGEKIFGATRSFLIPLFMLLLFVISASVTGLLVLGKPAHLYLNGSKQEAFVLLFSTLAWLVLFAVLVAAVMALY